MNHEQTISFRDAQETQRQQKEENIRKHKEQELAYHRYQQEILAFQALLDAKKIEIVKEQNKLQFQLNGMIVQTKRYFLVYLFDYLRDEIEKIKEMKQLYEPQAFFASFNKSTR